MPVDWKVGHDPRHSACESVSSSSWGEFLTTYTSHQVCTKPPWVVLPSRLLRGSTESPGLFQHFPTLEWAHVTTCLPFLLSVSCRRQVSERRLRPVPQKQRTLHEKILEEIKQERRLRPVGVQHLGARGEQGGEGNDGRENKSNFWAVSLKSFYMGRGPRSS